MEHIEVPSRIVHLPLSWDDGATRLAIEKYMQSVRNDAPWCPSNIEFIRRINGLRQHRRGAAHRLRGKLPGAGTGRRLSWARPWRRRSIRAIAWSPPSTTRRGHGRRKTRWASAAHTCASTAWKARAAISSLDAPCRCGIAIARRADFVDGKPWLLRFFDQIRFYPVSESELLKLRRDFITGSFKLRVEDTTFSLKQYNAFLEQNAPSINAFKSTQQAAFEAERERWKAEGKAEYVSEITVEEADTQSELDLPDGAHAVTAHVTGTVWKLLVQRGDRPVTAGEALW